MFSAGCCNRGGAVEVALPYTVNDSVMSPMLFTTGWHLQIKPWVCY